MPGALIELSVAKAHLRVFGDDDDSLITMWIEAAQSLAATFIGRNIYPDETARAAARAAVSAMFIAAAAEFGAATDAANTLPCGVQRDAALAAAGVTYLEAQEAARMTRNGVLIDSQIKAAILLILGHLHLNREDVVTGVTVAMLPNGSRNLLQPFRLGMGV